MAGRERMALLLNQDSASWEEMQEFSNLFTSVDSLQAFRELIASYTREESAFRARFEGLSGLAVFLERYCSDEERNTFFSSTLKFIVSSAISLKELLPDTGIPCLRAQENACLGLGRHLVVALIANAFLCTFPESKDLQNGDQEERQLSFADFYNGLHIETEKSRSIAAYLHCCLAYFKSLDKLTDSLDKTITFRRQALPLDEVPSLDAWQTCQLPLSAVDVENSENCGDPSALQVDIANFCLSGSAVESMCVGDKTHCPLYPELFVSHLILEPLQDNEALLIKGVERFVRRGESSEYVGESGELDLHGNFCTSLVAIDPVSFLEPLSPDQQYSNHYLLREVNKAFAGFLCPREAGDVPAESIASSRIQKDSPQVVYCDSYSSAAATAAVAPVSVEPQPAAQNETSNSISESPPTQPTAVEPESAVKPSVQIDSLVSAIIMSGVEKAASGCGVPKSSDTGGGKKMDDFAQGLSGSILSSVLSEKPRPMTSAPSEDTSSEAKIDDGQNPSKSDQTEEIAAPPPVATRTADLLSRSIIADVLSQDRTAPSPPPPTSPQTVGQPTSPAVEWQVHSYADQMADSILSSIFSGSGAPETVVKKPGECGQNTQSSSVTGQTITLHEFTDDLVEGVVREGLLIARLQARATEREPDVEGCEDGRGREGEGGGGGEEGGASRSCEQGASEVAELLVSRSIQSVLEDVMKSRREERVGESDRDKSGLHPHSGVGRASRRSESPMRSSAKLGLLRQTLEKPKQLVSATHDAETNELEPPTSSSLFLSAPSYRMSYAWSVASTRDEGSRPVSPTDLDRMALSFVSNLEEYCSMFAELVIRGAIAQVTGNKKYMCHVPVNRSHHSSRESLSATSGGELRMSVPMIHHPPPSLGEVEGENDSLTPSRLDTFLSNLGEAEPVGAVGEEGDEGGEQEFKLKSTVADKALLRTVATGNWGCGQCGGDPQLKSMLQWAAVSASSRSRMVYFPNHDQRLEQLVNVVAHVQAKQWRVSHLISALVDYCHLVSEERHTKTLFSYLLDQ